jgi:hypothetical protein
MIHLFYHLIVKKIKNWNKIHQNKILRIRIKAKNLKLIKKMMSLVYNSTTQIEINNLKMKIKIILYFKDKNH